MVKKQRCVVRIEGCVVRIEGCVVKKCKTVVKTLKTVVKINCIIRRRGKQGTCRKQSRECTPAYC